MPLQVFNAMHLVPRFLHAWPPLAYANPSALALLERFPEASLSPNSVSGWITHDPRSLPANNTMVFR